MALKGERLVYQSTQGVFCLDAKTGKQHWAVDKVIPYGRGNSPNSLVLSEEAVYSEEGGSVYSYALADGRDYWGKPIKARKGYQASTDLMIAADALWMCGACNNAQGIVIQKPTAYDLKTGNLQERSISNSLSRWGTIDVSVISSSNASSSTAKRAVPVVETSQSIPPSRPS